MRADSIMQEPGSWACRSVSLIAALVLITGNGRAAAGDPSGPPPDGMVPTVWLEVLDRSATEQSPDIDSIPDTASIALHRDGDVTEPLTIAYGLSGAAMEGVDFELRTDVVLNGAITIPAGEASVVIQVSALDDLEPEPGEDVVMTLLVPPGLPNEPPPFLLGPPAQVRVWILDNDAGENQPPQVAMVSPPDGAIFAAPSQILLSALAFDADGAVVQVEFFDGDLSLGAVPRDWMLDPALLDDSRGEWGPVAPFQLLWANPTAGIHVLTAVALDDAGASTVSDPVQVTILDVAPVPVVTVEATDAEAAEHSVGPNGSDVPNSARFTLHRSGFTGRELEVTFTLSGRAENGVDYVKVDTRALFRIGEPSVEVEIIPIDDDLAEGIEDVKLTLEDRPVIAIFPPPPGTYWIGKPSQARAWIVDDEEPANLPPVVDLLRPQDGEVFVAPADIKLLARAADRDGTIVSVEFFDGDRSLGFGEPDPDRPTLYRFDWVGVVPGDYAITAVATDDAGETQSSSAAHVKVAELQEPPVITIETLDGEAAEVPTDSAQPPNPAVMRVHRSGSTAEELTVQLLITGSAENGVDYVEIPQQAYFGPGESEVEISIVPLPDELEEGPESVEVTLMWVRCGTEDPTVDGRCFGVYVIGLPGTARAVIRDDDAPDNLAPRVAITSPQTGQIFPGPADIQVEVATRDPDGWVGKMALYAGQELIGEQEINFLREPDPGADQVFVFDWPAVPFGSYSLRAKATDDAGAEAWSGVVEITVAPESTRTVISVIAVDPVAVEPTTHDEGDPGMFAIYRRGDLDIPLPVFFSVRGTAENGLDYALIESEALIPAGQEAVRIPVVPLVDELPEEVESVVLVLRESECIAIEPPPPECYRVSEFGRAQVKILDRSGSLNRPPRIELVQPYPGEVFQAPTEMVLVAAAADPDGQVVKVEFFADGQRLNEQVADGTSTVAAADDTGATRFVWKDAAIGEHRLWATATDDDGAVTTSDEVVVSVIDSSAPPLVRVLAVDPFASEPTEGSGGNPGVFRIERTGSTDQDLLVFYSVGGTATAGKDYSELAGQVLIPAGKGSERVTVDAIQDNELELLETVSIELVYSPFMGPLEPYRIGTPSQACVVIVDNDRVTPVAGTLPGDGFQICLPAQSGGTYRVEVSDDMVHWDPAIDTLAGDDGQVRFTQPQAGQHKHRFYRLRPTVVEAVDFDP